jgi:pyrroline-5-carboxylate reductase
VTSPGGTTQAGLEILDEGGALKLLIAEATDAARRRSLELAAAAREQASD